MARARPMLVRRRAGLLAIVPTPGHRPPIEPDDESDRAYAGDAELVFDSP